MIYFLRFDLLVSTETLDLCLCAQACTIKTIEAIIIIQLDISSPKSTGHTATIRIINPIIASETLQLILIFCFLLPLSRCFFGHMLHMTSKAFFTGK